MPKYEWADGRVLEFDNEPSPDELNHAFSMDMQDRIKSKAEEYGVPLDVALGVAHVESGLDHTDAKGDIQHNPSSSAIGVYQMTKAARKDVGQTKDDVDSSIDGGLKYLKMLNERSGGDWTKTVQAYKQGIGSLDKEGPTDETQQYTQFVDSWGKKISRGLLKATGAGIGAIMGTPEAPGLGTAAGAALGYSAGQGIGNLLGVEPPSTTKQRVEDVASVGATTLGGALGGPLGFGAANAASNAIVNKINKGADYSPSEPGSIGPFKQMPYGGVAQDATLGTALDLLGRGAGKGIEAVVGLRTAKQAGKEALKEADTAAQQEVKQFGEELPTKINQATTEKDYVANQAAKQLAEKRAQIEGAVQRQYGPPTAQAELEAAVPPPPGRAIDPAEGGAVTQEAANNRSRIAEAVFAPQRRLQDELSEEYEHILGNHANKPADVTGLGHATQAQLNFLQKHNLTDQLSPQSAGLLQKIQGMASPKPGIRPTVIPGQGVTAVETVPGARATVRELMDMRKEASDLLAHGANPIDKSVGYTASENILQSLEDSGIETQALKDLNKRYKFTRDTFKGINSQVATKIDPADWGKRVFTQPDASARLWDAATPQERDSLREALGTYLYSRPSLRTAMSDVGEGTLRRYFGNSAYNRASTWLSVEPRMARLTDILNNNPEAQAAMTQKLQAYMSKQADTYGHSILSQATKLADKVGPIGRDFKTSLVGKSFQEQSQLAEKFLDDINPDKAIQAYTQGQPSNMARAAEMLGKKLPTATVEKLAWERTKRAAFFLGGSLLMGGHSAPWAALGLGYGAVSLPAALLRKAFYTSLHNPSTATAFLRALNSGRLDAMIPSMADAAIAASQRSNK